MNSILWGNGVAIANVDAIRISYSDIDDPGFAGFSGNISAPPMFVDASTGDYHLAPASPCIDAGNPDPLHSDADGSTCDMGAFGGTGYAPRQTWVTHIIRRFVDLTENIDVYWLATAFTDAVGQFTEDLLSGWSEGSALAPGEKWTPTGTDTPRQKFFRVLPLQ